MYGILNGLGRDSVEGSKLLFVIYIDIGIYMNYINCL